ncbi:hypothetical protein BC629DRAFT_951037 [Irpex lacteus]|nr:hypothetical protein BC629DRAFT_951037 [Irpex lacteus]
MVAGRLLSTHPLVVLHGGLSQSGTIPRLDCLEVWRKWRRDAATICFASNRAILLCSIARLTTSKQMSISRKAPGCVEGCKLRASEWQPRDPAVLHCTPDHVQADVYFSQGAWMRRGMQASGE